MREAATVGAVAGMAGAVLGVLLAPLIGRVLVDVGFEPASFIVGVHLWPVMASLLAGPLVAVAGSLAAARRAAGVGPLEARTRGVFAVLGESGASGGMQGREAARDEIGDAFGYGGLGLRHPAYVTARGTGPGSGHADGLQWVSRVDAMSRHDTAAHATIMPNAA